MRIWLVGLFVLLCSPVFAQQQTPPVIRFDSVPDQLKLPANLYFGEVSGVAVNSKDHVFILSRGNTTGPAYAAAAAQLLEFGPDGRYLREIGHNLYAWSFAHMVKVDRHDNIWVTDKGSDMVIKFTPEGRVAMVFGRKQEASDEETGPLEHPNPPLAAEPGRFRQVTDVAFDTADNTFISDGYINSRVAKVDKDGNWLKSWGERGKGPGQSQKVTGALPSHQTISVEISICFVVSGATPTAIASAIIPSIRPVDLRLLGLRATDRAQRGLGLSNAGNQAGVRKPLSVTDA